MGSRGTPTGAPATGERLEPGIHGRAGRGLGVPVEPLGVKACPARPPGIGRPADQIAAGVELLDLRFRAEDHVPGR